MQHRLCMCVCVCLCVDVLNFCCEKMTFTDLLPKPLSFGRSNVMKGICSTWALTESIPFLHAAYPLYSCGTCVHLIASFPWCEMYEKFLYNIQRNWRLISWSWKLYRNRKSQTCENLWQLWDYNKCFHPGMFDLKRQLRKCLFLLDWMVYRSTGSQERLKSIFVSDFSTGKKNPMKSTRNLKRSTRRDWVNDRSQRSKSVITTDGSNGDIK